ncbi:hypothetical protein [Sphingorhabdus sp. M41]|uniref:hypothetical protein n=1 Tax=Sphingorhabdus sp. M41 TaxID=1806885 RepID=UPI00078CB911|nr:hypothetical protein [Sphingorhabdus sp. M41]AMO71148.1 hypothetical protein AZE99_04150 [Sphingorhabdus sp. M41]
MKNFLSSGLIAASFALASATPASAEMSSDPASDADCVVSLMMLTEQADNASDKDAIATMALYYFGRLGGEGQANAGYLSSRMNRFAAEPEYYLAKSEQCATDFEGETQTLEQFETWLTN